MATARAYGPLDTDNDPTSTVPTSLVGLVRNWANRDLQALPNAIIMDAIRYAVDKAYRTLRIPPLEHTAVWTNYPGVYTFADGTAMDIADAAALAAIRETNPDGVYAGPLDDATSGSGNLYQSNTCIEVPPDLIEFIHIRGTDENGLTTRVFNEKSDIRSYWDINNGHYNQAAFWSRQGDSVIISPSFANVARGFYGGGAGPETRIEMYYYRRLPALNAEWGATFNNWMLGLGTINDAQGDPVRWALGNTEAEFDAAASTWMGDPIPNWFKDENEKIVLYGALAECFAYLQEDDQAGKYIQLMMKEIEELNEEDRMRDASGGNIQTQYTANGLI